MARLTDAAYLPPVPFSWGRAFAANALVGAVVFVPGGLALWLAASFPALWALAGFVVAVALETHIDWRRHRRGARP